MNKKGRNITVILYPKALSVGRSPTKTTISTICPGFHSCDHSYSWRPISPHDTFALSVGGGCCNCRFPVRGGSAVALERRLHRRLPAAAGGAGPRAEDGFRNRLLRASRSQPENLCCLHARQRTYGLYRMAPVARP